MELKCSKQSRGRLDTAFKEVIGASGTVRHFILRIQVEITDIEPSIEAEDVEDAVRGCFDHGSELELKETLTERPYRGRTKAYVLLKEARALKLLKATLIKSGGSPAGSAERWGKSMLPLSWLWPHVDELLRGRQKQKLLEEQRREEPCGILHKENAVLPLLR